MIEQAKALLADKDVLAAIEFLAAEPDPATALEAHYDLVNDLYSEAQDVPAMIAVALAGIQYGLGQAAIVEGSDPSLALHLRSRAKGLAYNLAANTWPGWDESGIELDGTAMALGLQAALANLRLAEDLDKGDLALSRAFWMLGGHYLASGRLSQAQEAYGKAEMHASLAGQEAESLLAAGFSLIVRLLMADAASETEKLPSANGPPSNRLRSPSAAVGEVQTELAGLKERLAPLENGEFFAQQIDTALHVFAGTEPASP